MSWVYWEPRSMIRIVSGMFKNKKDRSATRGIVANSKGSLKIRGRSAGNFPKRSNEAGETDPHIFAHMRPFLQQVVEDLSQDRGNDLSKLTLVLPSRRAGLFVRKYIGERTERPTWAPEILTIEDFLRFLTPYHIPEDINLLFHLYGSYLRVADPDRRQDLDKFSKWGNLFLRDINEIDNQLVPAGQLFTGIRQVREIEHWSLNASELSEGQERFVQFWEMLGTLYEAFRTDLRSEGMAYPGMAIRELAEEPGLGGHSFGPDSVHFIGFNALSTAQETLIRHFLREGYGWIYWDADPYYMKDRTQEAGMFLRKTLENWDEQERMCWYQGGLTTNDIRIEVTGVPKVVGQVKTAARDLPADAAMVLADQSLLMPTLNSLPEDLPALNITMQYPLDQTPLHDLFTALFTLRENAGRFQGTTEEKEAGLYHHKDIARIIRHPYFASLFGKDRHIPTTILDTIKERNTAFLTPTELKEVIGSVIPESKAIVSALFDPWDRIPGDVLNGFKTLTEALKQSFGKDERRTLDMEYLYEYARNITRLSTLLETHPYVHTLAGFKRIFNRAIRGAGLAFYGEPLQGLQLMGMLETRSLDFREVILLAANEDVLPGTRPDDSLIPFDLQNLYGLPTHREKEAIHAYHFYRLLQRAEKVRIFYNTEEEGFGASEKSRFLTQLLYEFPEKNPNGRIQHHIARPVTQMPEPETPRIEKTEPLIETLREHLQKGVSPTALSTYTRCPLDFYYQYVLGLREPAEVEETIEARTLGIVAHQVMEDHFGPWKGQVVHPDAIQKMIDETPQRVREAFKAEFPAREVERGKNLLLTRMTEKSLVWLLRREKADLIKAREKGAELTVLGVEEWLKRELRVPMENETLSVPLHGKADRIDRLGDQVRIIDHKSGLVEPRDLKINGEEGISGDQKKDKALQLMTYAWLYDIPENHELSAGICSLRRPQRGVMPLLLDQKAALDRKRLDSFEEMARGLIQEILDPSVPFEHDTESQYCTFCQSS